MKTLKFEDKMVPLILFGEKISTWRLFDDKDLKVGDELSFVNKEDGKEFITAKIISIREKPLGAITNKDFEGHEPFENKKMILETYKKYYGNKVTLETKVKMIDFKVL